MSLEKFKKHKPKKRRGKRKESYEDPSSVFARYGLCWEEENGDERKPLPSHPMAGITEAQMVIRSFGKDSLTFVEWAASVGKPMRCCDNPVNHRRFRRWMKKKRKSSDPMRDVLRGRLK